MEADASIAQWALGSYPERGDGNFVVQMGHTDPLGLLESLRGYFVSLPFMRCFQRWLSRDDVSISIENQEKGAALWQLHGEKFLRDMYSQFGEGQRNFDPYDEAVDQWMADNIG